MKRDDCISILDIVATILESPRWDAEVGSFIDCHCIIFDGAEENSSEHHTRHNEFIELVDARLKERLLENGISEDDFSKACMLEMDSEQNILSNNVIDQLLAVADFNAFKLLMVERNVCFEMEALASLTGSKQDYNRAEDERFQAMRSKPMRLTFANFQIGDAENPGAPNADNAPRQEQCEKEPINNRGLIAEDKENIHDIMELKQSVGSTGSQIDDTQSGILLTSHANASEQSTGELQAEAVEENKKNESDKVHFKESPYKEGFKETSKKKLDTIVSDVSDVDQNTDNEMDAGKVITMPIPSNDYQVRKNCAPPTAINYIFNLYHRSLFFLLL